MAYSPILGHDNATPVLNPAGTVPVVMTSPIPYAQWAATVIDNPFGTITSGANWWRVDAVKSGSVLTGYAELRILMFSTKPAETLRVTLTTGGDSGAHSVRVTPYVAYVSQGNTDLVAGGTTTADIPVPYYRYRFTLIINLQQLNSPPATATWARADFALI